MNARGVSFPHHFAMLKALLFFCAASCALAILAADALPPDHAQRMTKGLEIFQHSAKAILVENCVGCHGGEKTKGELNIVTREGLLKGGADGIMVVPFKAADSRLLKLVRHEEEPHMPDKKPMLSAEKIQSLADWIDNGAPYEGELLEAATVAKKEKGVINDEDRNWWAFQPLKEIQPPAVKGLDHPIDRFIAAKAAEKGLKISEKAERRTLIRRLYLDLLGLPPTPEEVDAFVKDSKAGAWDRLVERTLASPHYGERWGRHWLDVARFAESSGFEHDYDREGAYQFRDFVIRALNADMPFDQFLRWQLAGDEFAPDNPMALAATGFLGAGVFPTQITANEVERTRYDAMDDMLSTTSLAFLGLTVGCARCHDHKFDPFPTADYYRLLSTFTTTTRSVIEIDPEPEKSERARKQWAQEQARLELAVSDYETGLRAKFSKWLTVGDDDGGIPWANIDGVKRTGIKVGPFHLPTEALTPALSHGEREKKAFAAWRKRDGNWRTLAKRAEAHTKTKPWMRKALVCAEGYTPLRMHTQGADFFEETYILRRGNTDAKNGVAKQDFLQVLMRAPERGEHWKFAPPQGAKFSGRRRSLANWMTDLDAGAGAQVARVIVNRLWQHHFGTGLVATPNDFGHAGAPPTHPELLDWLAGELVRSGWKLKRIHGLILTSATYQQTTITDAAKQTADPENKFFVRRLPRRLEGEALRDSVLAVTGALDPTMYGPGTLDEKSVRRSIYFTVKRSQLVGSMVVFDLPEPLVSQAVRPTTTVAPQALFLMNAPEVREWAKLFAQRLQNQHTTDEKIRRAFLLALGREPFADELKRSADFIAASPAETALVDFCQVVLGLNEFAYEN
jgi:cytochrome c553